LESSRCEFAADMRLEGLFHRANIDLAIGEINDESTLDLVRRNKIVNEDLESGGMSHHVSRSHIIGQRSVRITCQVRRSEDRRRVR
jgi:hypothetical protein